MEAVRRAVDKVLLVIGVVAVLGTLTFLVVHFVRLATEPDYSFRHLPRHLVSPPGQPTAEPLPATTPPTAESAPRFVSPPQRAVMETTEARTPPPAPTQIEAPLCEWLKGFQLTCVAGADEADPDGDGWTNREEWKFQTNPTNALSAPRLEQCLVLAQVVPRIFPLKFSGYVRGAEGQYSFALNDLQQGKTLFVRLDDSVVVGNDTWLVRDFRPLNRLVQDAEIPTQHQRDVSELTLSRLSDGRWIVLVYRQERIEGYAGAELWNVLNNQRHTLAVGQELEIKGQRLRLEEIAERSAVLIGPRGQSLRLTLSRPSAGS